MSLCLFILFLSLIHFLCTCSHSVSRCASLLWVGFSLSSMSLTQDFSIIDRQMSSLTFAAADDITRASLLSFLDLRSCCCWNGTRQNLPLHPDAELVHQDVLQICVQDVHHLVGDVSAVAPLPARRSRRCSHFLCRSSCAPSSLIFSIGCGRCSCSRFPAVMSNLLSFLLSSLITGCRRPTILTPMLTQS